MSQPTRIIHHTDAIKWLESTPKMSGCSIVTSLPDISEFPKLRLEDWKTWFINTAALVLSRCSDDGVAIFYQSDIKVNGVWVDKSFLVQKAAEQRGHELISHKIVCRVPAGTSTRGRPSYSHLICFSKNIRTDIEKSTVDVLTAAGPVTWTRGMGVEACRFACQFILDHTKSHTVVDPFCGHGSVLAVANNMGLNAIGVEIVAKNATIAKNLKLGIDL